MSLDHFHLNCSPSTLNRAIVRKIRAAACKIDSFEEGAIAVRFVAKCLEAAEWLDCMEASAGDANVDVDFIHSIIPGKSKTRRPGWRGNPENHEVSCAGYVMLKLEGCARAVIGDYGRCSDDLPPQLVTGGRVNSRGAMCFDITPPNQDFSDENPWLRIYVGVSGASGEEDKWCAWHTHDALNELSKSCSCIITAPTYNPNLAVEKGLITFRDGILTTEGIV